MTQVDTSVLDGHTRFHLGEVYAMAGDTTRALELVEQAVDTNFFPRGLAHHIPFIGPLRTTDGFARILAKAERRIAEFDA